MPRAPQTHRVPKRPVGNRRPPVTETTAQRVAKLELTIVNMERALDIQFKRIAAMQAQLDAFTLKASQKR